MCLWPTVLPSEPQKKDMFDLTSARIFLEKPEYQKRVVELLKEFYPNRIVEGNNVKTPTRALFFSILHRCIFVLKRNISAQGGGGSLATYEVPRDDHHSLPAPGYSRPTGCVAPCGPRTWRLPLSAHRVTLRRRSIVSARMLRVAHRKICARPFTRPHSER